MIARKNVYKWHKNCPCKHSVLAREQEIYLKRIGLSKSAIRLYDLSLLLGPISAQDAATHTFEFPSSEYRLLYLLQSKNLLRRLPGRPRKFQALPVLDGLQASLASEERELTNLIKHDTSKNDGSAAILIGREKLYSTYINYANKAQKQICIYAIGIAYSKALAKTQTNAIKRGIYIRHVVQEVKPQNYHAIDKWVKAGVDLRILKKERGYHLTIIDDICAIVTFSDSQDTEKRISMQTNNPAIICIFQTQFEEIWQAAKEINI